MANDIRGRRVLLLHGFGGSFEHTFARNGWVEALRSIDKPLMGVDLPGHGAGPLAHAPEVYADLAGAVLELLPEEPVDVVGFSLGAKVMLDMAIRWPERFGRLVAGGIGDNIFSPEKVSAEAAHWLKSVDPRAAPPPLGAIIGAALDEGRDPLALAAVFERPPNPVFDDSKLARLRAPLLLVAGSDDLVAGSAARLRAAVPHATETRIYGAAHFDLPANDAFKVAAANFLGPA